MSVGDVLVGLAVGLLDGALFGVVGLLCGLGAVTIAKLPGGLLAVAGGFTVVWLPVSAYSYYRFQRDKRYFPVFRRYLALSVRYSAP